MALKKLVFLGTGQAHLYALAAFKKTAKIDTDIHLITSYDHVVYSDMVPGMVAGHYSAEDCTISIPKLLGNTAIKITYADCTGIDANTQEIKLSNGSTLHYDVLSVDTGSMMDKDAIEARIPGAKQHAVFVRPVERFTQLWPQILEFAQPRQLRISVIGAGAAGVELAMALQLRLPHCHISLIAGSVPPAAEYKQSVQKRVLLALKKRNITVLQDTCVSMDATQLQLASGAQLACDVPLLTLGCHPATWLADSGFALDERGYVSVNRCRQSTSHTNVFDMGDVAMNNGASLYANVLAMLANLPLKPASVVSSPINLIACGGRTAIASWGNVSFQGNWVWRWKTVRDLRWLRQYKL